MCAQWHSGVEKEGWWEWELSSSPSLHLETGSHVSQVGFELTMLLELGSSRLCLPSTWVIGLSYFHPVYVVNSTRGLRHAGEALYQLNFISSLEMAYLVPGCSGLLVQVWNGSRDPGGLARDCERVSVAIFTVESRDTVKCFSSWRVPSVQIENAREEQVWGRHLNLLLLRGRQTGGQLADPVVWSAGGRVKG